MTDKLTTPGDSQEESPVLDTLQKSLSSEERVKLAVFCGKTVRAHTNFPGRLLCEDGTHWNPAEDANQWDEIWNMLGESGYVLELSNREDQAYDPISCCHLFSTDLTVDFDITEDTRGDAVCRAALKVIGDTNAD